MILAQVMTGKPSRLRRVVRLRPSASTALRVSRFSSSDRSLTDGSAPPSDYAALTVEQGLRSGSPVGRCVVRDALATVTTRSTVALATDWHQRHLDVRPATNERGGKLVDYTLAAADSGTGQCWLGSWLPSAGDYTVAMLCTPRQNGVFLSWHSTNHGLMLITTFAGARVFVRLNNGVSTGNLAGPASSVMTPGTTYWLMVTYTSSTGGLTFRIYTTTGTLIHNGSATSYAGLDCTGTHRLGASAASAPAGDVHRMLVYSSVLSTAAQDAIPGGTIGSPARDYSGAYSGCYDAASPTTLYYATGSGYPVRAGTHPTDSHLVVLTGQSNAIGTGTTIDPEWLAAIGRLEYDGAAAWEYDSTPGLERWLLDEEPSRAVYRNGLAGTTISQHIGVYGPQARTYLLTDSVTPRAVVMWQGEADSGDSGLAAAYEGQVETYVAAWRAVYPGIPVIWLGPIVAQTSGGSYDYADTVRAALATVAAGDADFHYIDTSASGLNLSTSDSIHADNTGMATAAAEVESRLQTLGIW